MQAHEIVFSHFTGNGWIEFAQIDVYFIYSQKYRYFCDYNSDFMISRVVQNQVESQLSNRKVLIILGARQVGKTTLIQNLKLHPEETLFLNGDDLTVRKQLEEVGLEKWKLILGVKKYLVIDEAQRIEDISLKVKLIADQLDFKVILSGSSALELANTINEPLTGRKWETKLFPFAFEEMVKAIDQIKETSLLCAVGVIFNFEFFNKILIAIYGTLSMLER